MLWTQGHNAPYDARCFLTELAYEHGTGGLGVRLNAPYGARCFLTQGVYGAFSNNGTSS